MEIFPKFSFFLFVFVQTAVFFVGFVKTTLKIFLKMSEICKKKKEKTFPTSLY